MLISTLAKSKSILKSKKSFAPVAATKRKNVRLRKKQSKMQSIELAFGITTLRR